MIFTRNKLAGLLGLAAIASGAHALEPEVVTFDHGTAGWMPGSDCGTIIPDDGRPGAHWNIVTETCDGSTLILQPYFILSNNTNPAFVGDFTEKGPVRLALDLDVTDFTYFRFNMPVEEYRQVVFEFIDYDDPYVDPETGYSWPWTSVVFAAGHLPDRDAGWKRFVVDIENPNSETLPEGWSGFGGPEDENYNPQLPPGVTFADVMAGVDELQIHAIEPGYVYDFGFIYDLKFDNISIQPLVHECKGRGPTVFVDREGIVRGGPMHGHPYKGVLVGTDGDDVMLGTPGEDLVQGFAGNDLICGGDGNDRLVGGHGDDMLIGDAGDDVLLGQQGVDYLSGGAGHDQLNGGAGADTCITGEVLKFCGD